MNLKPEAEKNKRPKLEANSLAYGAEAADRLSNSKLGSTINIAWIRGIFLALLERFPIPEVRRFWQEHLIAIGNGMLPEAEVYRRIWGSNMGISSYHFERIECSLESFLWTQGVPIGDFFNEDYWRFQKGGLWKSSENLAWVKDLLPQLYLEPEPMLTILTLLCRWGVKSSNQSASCQIPYLRIDEKITHAVFSFATEHQFRYRIMWNFPGSAIPFIRFFPMFFGLSEFEKVGMLAHCMHPEHILWRGSWEIRNGEFFVENLRYGKVVRFSDWARERDLRFQGQPVPEREVILIEKEFRCPVRERVVLSSGCVYDAPVYLSAIQFPTNPKPTPFVIDHIISGVIHQESLDLKSLGEKYENLISAANQRLCFEYRSETQSIFLNGKTMITGVPAKILRKILVGRCSGQATFDFRSFKYDPDIFPNPKLSGFETRWNRLREKLDETTPLARLEKSGKGEFVFKASCPVEFQDLG